jgi:hypothetical protein
MNSTAAGIMADQASINGLAGGVIAANLLVIGRKVAVKA